MRWVLRVFINAVAIWAATAIVPGVHLRADDDLQTVIGFAVVGALFGIVNTVIRPVVRIVTLPFIVLTLGLLLVVINAAMLELVDWMSGAFGIDFDSGPFWWSTILAAVVVSLVGMILDVLLGDRQERERRRHEDLRRRREAELRRHERLRRLDREHAQHRPWRQTTGYDWK